MCKAGVIGHFGLGSNFISYMKKNNYHFSYTNYIERWEFKSERKIGNRTQKDNKDGHV